MFRDRLVAIPGGRLIRTGIQELVPRYLSIPEVNILKNSLILAVSVPTNLSIKLGFVSVNGPRKLTLWTRQVVRG